MPEELSAGSVTFLIPKGAVITCRIVAFSVNELNPTRRMHFLVIGNKYRLNSIHLFNQFHPFLIAKQKAGRTKRICFRRGIRNDRYTVKVVLTRISGTGIENVVVEFSVFLKIPFIDSGGYNCLVF